MHHRLLLHLVWTTRYRERSIDARRATMLVGLLRDVARQERCLVIACGIVSTHLHLLVGVHHSTHLPTMLQRMKGGTAHELNRADPQHRRPLRWARGYSATTVSPGAVDRVAEYVRNQAKRHPDEAIPGWVQPE
jgi:REP element-mobilizing transposase RayT